MWLWVLQAAGGVNLSPLPGATNRRLSYKRSSTAEATADLPLDHDDAYLLIDALRNGVPILRCFRVERQADGSELVACRFAGPILPLDEDTDSKVLTFTARGAFEVLEGRFVDGLYARDLMPVADVAAELITTTEAEHPTGIELGTIEDTAARDVSFENKRIADAITDLIDDFDYELVPLADDTGQGPTLARFDAWARQGGDLTASALFGYGEGTLDNCTSASRKTTRPVNRVLVTGDQGLTATDEDADSIARYGLWTETESMSDVIDLGRLQARATELLRPDPVRVVSFTPNPAKVDDDGSPITPQPWLDYWLGDDVTLSVRDGAFEFDGAVRVDGIDIAIGDDGYESEHNVQIATGEG